MLQTARTLLNGGRTPLRWTLENESDYVLVRVEGEWHIQSVLKILDEIERECRAVGQVRVLCDLRAVYGHVSEADRYLAGSRIGDSLAGVRFAVVVNEKVLVTQTAVKVAARRGGVMLSTRDMDEARRWLLAGPC